MELDLYKNDFPDLTKSSGAPTFSLENSLPSYPLPSLAETLDLYLTSTRPFLSEAEFAKTQAVVREFESGPGRELHAKLQQRANEQRNWIADWWFQYAYLANRTALHPLLNMAGVGPYHQQYWPARDGTAVERAAAMCRYYGLVWSSLREQTFPIDKNGAGAPMSMDQFRRYFSTCQIPGRDFDTMASHFRPRVEGDAPKHFLVLLRGRLFVLDLVDETEQPYSVAEYHSRLSQLVKLVESGDGQAAGSVDAGSVAGLHGLSRSQWSVARQQLAELNPSNRANLDQIERAVFVLSFLLDECGNSPEQLLRLAISGDIKTLLPDKSCNLMVTRDGVWLNNCGHTPMDAMVIVLTTFYVEGQVYRSQGRIEGGPEDPAVQPLQRPPPPPRELRFVTNAGLTAEAARGFAENSAQRASLDSLPHEFTDFGRAELRRLLLHPDTVTQLALQLAYWRGHGGRPAPTYQTATTRQFHRGRTETIRSCTLESVAMCRAVTAAINGTATAAEARAAIMTAHNRHNELRARCESGRGCDRHLLGLQLLALESGAPLPALFADPAYAKSGGGGNFVLSTSYLGSYTGIGCVAPMCASGYGVFYRIGPAKIFFNLTRWTADADTCLKRLARHVGSSLTDIRRFVIDGQETGTAAAARL